MPVRYLTVRPQQEPFDLLPDSEKRLRVVFNVLSFKRPSDTFLEELVAILVAAGVGVSGTSIGGSSQKEIPALTGAGEFFVSIIETSGFAPVYTQERVAPAYQQPSAQIVVRARDYVLARLKARAAYNALSVVRNQNVTG